MVTRQDAAMATPLVFGPSTVLGAGTIRAKRATVEDRVLGRHALVLIVAGRGWFRSGRESRSTVSAGDLLVLFPEVSHGYGPTEPGLWDEHWVMVSGHQPAAWEADLLFDRSRPLLHPGCDAGLVRAFAALPGLWRGGMDQPRLVARVHDLLVEALRLDREQALAASQQQRDTTRRLDAARRELSERLHLPCAWDRVARGHGFSPERFRKLYRLRFGVAPARDRLGMRIALAQSLLAEGQTDAAAIAERCGFCHSAHLHRHFRAIAGMTPAAWRQMAGG